MLRSPHALLLDFGGVLADAPPQPPAPPELVRRLSHLVGGAVPERQLAADLAEGARSCTRPGATARAGKGGRTGGTAPLPGLGGVRHRVVAPRGPGRRRPGGRSLAYAWTRRAARAVRPGYPRRAPGGHRGGPSVGRGEQHPLRCRAPGLPRRRRARRVVRRPVLQRRSRPPEAQPATWRCWRRRPSGCRSTAAGSSATPSVGTSSVPVAPGRARRSWMSTPAPTGSRRIPPSPRTPRVDDGHGLLALLRHAPGLRRLTNNRRPGPPVGPSGRRDRTTRGRRAVRPSAAPSRRRPPRSVRACCGPPASTRTRRACRRGRCA